MTVSSQHIADFLSQNKTVSLEKIGVLDLNNKDDKDIFTYNNRAETSPEFIQYLTEIFNKPELIVSQDLIYYLDQSRQLMNIRASSLIINGIGYIHANNAGEYVFNSDTSDTLKETDKKSFDDVYKKTPLTSSVNYATKKNKKSLWRWIAVIAILGTAISYAAYYNHTHSGLSFFNDSHDSAITAKTDISKTEKEQAKIAAQPDSKLDTNTINTKGFKFIIQTFTNILDCQKRQQQLKNYGNIVDRDTITVNNTPVFRLYVRDTSAMIADTTHIKDSLRTYFGYPVSIEK